MSYLHWCVYNESNADRALRQFDAVYLNGREVEDVVEFVAGKDGFVKVLARDESGKFEVVDNNVVCIMTAGNVTFSKRKISWLDVFSVGIDALKKAIEAKRYNMKMV